MKRVPVQERRNWRDKMEEIGFTFHSQEGVYWDERVCYAFSTEEIDLIEEVSEGLHRLCLEAVGYVIEKNLYSKIGIPEKFAPLIKRSWERQDRSLYGRFDFSFDPPRTLKLLEYNADTPTSLIESSIAQWVWLEDVFPDRDQFNSIHEKLGEAFQQLREGLPIETPFYFSCVKEDEEDLVNLDYLRDVALQAGLEARLIFIEDIGFSDQTHQFYDLEEQEIRLLFKLYPWEWMVKEDFGEKLLWDSLRIVEPPWKMILSSKGILPLLWDLAPSHPNLLPCYFHPGPLKGPYVRKPFFSREGTNISLFNQWGPVMETEGPYGEEGFIYQKAQELPCFDGQYAVIGSWIINGQAAGMGIREDETPITRDTSRFVPHYFNP
jgi:glutathionylspermidine synthase